MTTFFVAITVAALAFIGAAKQSKRRSRKNSKSRREQAKKAEAKRARELEKEIKAEQKIVIIGMEIEAIENEQNSLIDFYYVLKAQHDNPRTTEARRISLERQMLSIDTKIARLDLKRAKLFQQIEAA